MFTLTLSGHGHLVPYCVTVIKAEMIFTDVRRVSYPKDANHHITWLDIHHRNGLFFEVLVWKCYEYKRTLLWGAGDWWRARLYSAGNLYNAVPRFGEFHSCCCLPPLPQLVSQPRYGLIEIPCMSPTVIRRQVAKVSSVLRSELMNHFNLHIPRILYRVAKKTLINLVKLDLGRAGQNS